MKICINLKNNNNRFRQEMKKIFLDFSISPKFLIAFSLKSYQRGWIIYVNGSPQYGEKQFIMILQTGVR